MPLKMLDATVSNFDSVFEKFRSEAPKYKANLILFLADKDPSTSLSWCPGISFWFIFLVFHKILMLCHLPMTEFLGFFLLLLQIICGILFFGHSLLISGPFIIHWNKVLPFANDRILMILFLQIVCGIMFFCHNLLIWECFCGSF